jgi:hypothetical protein
MLELCDGWVAAGTDKHLNHPLQGDIAPDLTKRLK